MVVLLKTQWCIQNEMEGGAEFGGVKCSARSVSGNLATPTFWSANQRAHKCTQVQRE